MTARLVDLSDMAAALLFLDGFQYFFYELF
jgi:hypothetical protein